MRTKKSEFVVALAPLIALTLCLGFSAQAQTYTYLTSFQSSSTGSGPESPLIQGIDANFYGTASGYGAAFGGTVYKVTPGGALSTLYSFCGYGRCTSRGSSPNGGLVQLPDGNFYGTTTQGGTNGDGTVFKLTPGGRLRTLHSFNGADGSGPYAGLLLSGDGNFYGTTTAGGAYGYGTVFKITPAGALTTLYSFNLGAGEGYFPYAPLIEAGKGNFYGTAVDGGANHFGTIFKITSSGALTTLHTFDFNSEGGKSYGGLVRGNDGSFYGATSAGGTNAFGSIFKMAPNGILTVLHAFNHDDGAMPTGSLIQATDGNFYGTTFSGGSNAAIGTIFKITPGGVFTELYDFVNNSTGESPWAGLIQGTDGTLYGTTSFGGTGACGPGCGTVFSLGMGLDPFVKAAPPYGRVGRSVTILGSNLTGTTAVSFNGSAATFTVVSGTEIRTTIPAGATTGLLSVVTPGGTLSSNAVFHLIP